jgi:acyl-CoA thioesterase FadM
MNHPRIELPANLLNLGEIPIRITDVNYGGHVGNDAILSLIHEIRMKLLGKFGYSEMNIEGLGLIMARVNIEYRSQLFYGDTVHAAASASNFTSKGFDIYYHLQKNENGKLQTVAKAFTTMMCYDYATNKIAGLPTIAEEKLSKS